MSKTPVTPAEVRSWALENRYEVGLRGRLSAEVVGAYNRAHPRRKYEA